MTSILARQERFDRVGSTNDVVRDWLADGTPEVCLAVAREQTAGRGREGRQWIAPPGAALLVSLGFRPDWLAPDHVWRLAAVASLAMAEAAEEAARLEAGTIRLKLPNDLVVADGTPTGIRKVAGVLGETDGLGTNDPRVVVGLGLNADWEAADFPPDLAPGMTSLRVISGGRHIDGDGLLDGFVGRLGPRVDALRAGGFDGVAWADRQVTTGRTIWLQSPTGTRSARALGVDQSTGALVLADSESETGERAVVVGEVTHVRLAERFAEAV